MFPCTLTLSPRLRAVLARMLSFSLARLFLRSARWGACAWAGDSSGICAEHLSEARRRAITAHWIECGRRWYSRRGETEKSWAGTSAPKCPICEVPLIACGAGEEFDSWACDGCGKKATSHVDGRVAWAERGFNGFLAGTRTALFSRLRVVTRITTSQEAPRGLCMPA